MVTRTKRHNTNGTNNTGKKKVQWFFKHFQFIQSAFVFFSHLMLKTTSIFNKSYDACQQFAMRESNIYTTISLVFFSPCFHDGRLRGCCRSKKYTYTKRQPPIIHRVTWLIMNECVWCWMLKGLNRFELYMIYPCLLTSHTFVAYNIPLHQPKSRTTNVTMKSRIIKRFALKTLLFLLLMLVQVLLCKIVKMKKITDLSATLEPSNKEKMNNKNNIMIYGGFFDSRLAMNVVSSFSMRFWLVENEWTAFVWKAFKFDKQLQKNS